MSTIKVTDENFEQVVLQSDMPFILDAFADWCGSSSPSIFVWGD